MAYGFEIYDSSGNLLINLSKRVPRVLGTISSGTTNGSYADARLAGGIPFFVTTSQLNSTGGGAYFNYPSVSITSSGLSWTFTGFGTNLAVTIVYGFT